VSHTSARRRYAPLTRRSICLRLDMALKRSICPAGRGEKAQSTLVATGNISNFEQSEKYIEWSQSDHISSCVATYRQILHLFGITYAPCEPRLMRGGATHPASAHRSARGAIHAAVLASVSCRYGARSSKKGAMPWRNQRRVL